METPIEIEMNDRKSNIARMIYDAGQIEIFNRDKIANLFEVMAKPLEFYKYFGSNEKIIEFLDNEIKNDTNGLKDFLLLEYNSIPLDTVILSYLK